MSMRPVSIAVALAAIITVGAFVVGSDAPRHSKSSVAAPAKDTGQNVVSPASTGSAGDEEAEARVQSSVIQFPDGDMVQVTWRVRDIFDHVSPPYGKHYEPLRDLALEGDPYTAFSLFLVLDECKGAFESQDEVTAEINRLRETHMLRFPQWGNKILRARDSTDVEPMISRIQAHFDKCEPITAEQKSEGDMWLKKAASGGPTTAMIWYGTVLDDHDKAVLMLERAWNDGAYRALPELAKRYQENFDSGMVPTDKIRAFAALYAYAKLLEHAQVTHGYPPGRAMERAESAVELRTALMHEHEIKEGIEAAKIIIRSNPNCCFGI